MSVIVLGLLVAGLVSYALGIWRAKALARKSEAKLHSRPGYFGGYLAAWVTLPALFATLIWGVAERPVLQSLLNASLPESVQSLSSAERSLVIGRINAVTRGVARLSEADLDVLDRARYGFAPVSEARRVLQERGVVLGAAPEPYMIAAAYDQARNEILSRRAAAALAAALAAAGFIYAFSRMTARLRARNAVETVVLGGLIGASTIAILTTVGIVFSMLFEAIHFFSFVPPLEFFLGTVWDPRFSASGAVGATEGQFGLLPLFWGTLFISAVAMFVAVPVGLMSAIYMSEYASRPVRTVAKPLLEILAGIPTIVYGLFALITFGPFLRDAGGAIGLNISANSVLTAGVVMGVMIIPFVSSLSDDIINAVPQSLRDGSYGLGATQSETIKRVVFPAALPGIVGAILLAVSRAIGETMIVVLAAGIAANLTINPMEPVTTITVKIVSQLTGDLEFNSPQTLVAFALGLTLFTITLGLNIYALYVVRKYREQYE